jgi:hypothetical protein
MNGDFAVKRVRTSSGPPTGKNRRFVLAEMLRHEKHSDTELSEGAKPCNENALGDQGRFSLIFYDLALWSSK